MTTHNPRRPDLKEEIMKAAELHGLDGNGKDGLLGYLSFLAYRKPELFTQLLGRVLPRERS